MFFNGFGNRVAINDSIQANYGLCLVSSMIIFLQLTSVNLLCHQHEHGRHFGIIFSSILFQMYEGDISWNCASHVIC